MAFIKITSISKIWKPLIIRSCPTYSTCLAFFIFSSFWIMCKLQKLPWPSLFKSNVDSTLLHKLFIKIVIRTINCNRSWIAQLVIWPGQRFRGLNPAKNKKLFTSPKHPDGLWVHPASYEWVKVKVTPWYAYAGTEGKRRKCSYPFSTWQ